MPMYRAKADTLRHHLEALKALCETVTIRPVLDADRQGDGSAIKPLQGLEHRPVVLPEQFAWRRSADSPGQCRSDAHRMRHGGFSTAGYHWAPPRRSLPLPHGNTVSRFRTSG